MKVSYLIFVGSFLVSVECVSNMVSNGVAFSGMDVTLPNVLDILTRGASGKREKNFGGGNLGSYYNFMYPDNDDYPWACVCNKADYQLWLKDEQPYVRCKNQEDLSMQNIQANCDPTNVTNSDEF